MIHWSIQEKTFNFCLKLYCLPNGSSRSAPVHVTLRLPREVLTHNSVTTYELNCLFVREQIKQVHAARTGKNCRRKVMNTGMENKYPYSSSLIKKVQEPRYKGPCIERSGYNDPSHIIPTSVYIVHDVFKFVSLIRFHYFSHAWTADKSFCTSSWFYYTAAS